MHFWPWNSSISDDRALSQTKLSFVYLEPKSSHSTILVRVMGAESVCSGQTGASEREEIVVGAGGIRMKKPDLFY